MNDNFEKTRVDAINLMERQIQALQQEVSDLKPLAAKWSPKASGEMADGGQESRVTLHFGGKAAGVSIPTEVLLQTPETDLVTSIIQKLSETLIEDQFRDVIKVEVAKLQQVAKTLTKAGKW